MKLTTLLIAQTLASSVKNQPDGSALLQLRKTSVLSASANIPPGNFFYGPAECDKDELATMIENLGTDVKSKEESLEKPVAQLPLREGLVTAQKSSIEGFEGVLSNAQKLYEERTTEISSWQKTISEVKANLTSYQEERTVKNNELNAAKAAQNTARSKVQISREAYGVALVDFRSKGRAAAEQRTVVEESKVAVKDATTAVENAQKNANSVCTEAADLRAKATAASAAHAAAEQALKKATDAHTKAVAIQNTRRTELSRAQQTLEAAIASRADAAKKRAAECRQSNTAELKAGSAEKSYRDKQKECSVLEAEEQRLIMLQSAAQTAYDAASREATAASRALGEAEKALAEAQQVHQDASDDLKDAQTVQANALQKESTLCDKAQQAEDKLAATISLLREAEDAESKAQFDDFTASNALTTALSVETQSCDAAGKANCAMNRAKGALDAAKLRYDTAVEERKAQEAVVKKKSAGLDAAKTSLEEAKSTVATAEAQHSEAGKAKAIALAKQAAKWLLLKAAKWKVSIAVIAQGRAKASWDTAIEAVNCVTARHKQAVEEFNKAAAKLAEKEKTKNICEEDVKATKEPKKAAEHLDKLQVAYDALEIQVGVWKRAKAKMDSLEIELRTKTKNSFSMKVAYEVKAKYTNEMTKKMREAQAAYDQASSAFAAACKALSSAYDHMVSWQKKLEVRVDIYNVAVDAYNAAQQYLNDLIAAELSAKMAYEQAEKYWNAKVKDHGEKKGKCSDAEVSRKTAEENKDKTATALAEATAQVESLEKRRRIDTSSRDQAKSHCREARAERVDSDAELAKAEKAKGDAAAAVAKAKKAKNDADAVHKAALDKQAKAKTELEKATTAATKKTAASIKCDTEEEQLRLAWVKADAKAEQEQKQCATACAGLTAANKALEAAQSAYDTAFANYQAATTVVSSTEATKLSAASAETAAASKASGAESRAVKKEALCTKLQRELEVLKSELVTAQNTEKAETEAFAKMTAAANAAKTTLLEKQREMKTALDASGAADAAALLAQEALDEVENCIDTNQRNLLYLNEQLAQAQTALENAQALINQEQSKVERAKAVLVSYENDVKRLKLEIEAAQAALDAAKKALKDAETTLETCVSSRCEVPTEPIQNYDTTQTVPNLVNGATWAPKCERGFKVDFCEENDKCGSEVAFMTCTEGHLSPPIFRCAPVLSGTLVVQVIEGRQLSFGEEQFNYSDFQFHPIPSDPYVRIEACTGLDSMQQQQTSVKKNAYDAVWSDEAPMSFRIDGSEGCNSFAISVRDDREDDESRCEWTAMDYVGAVEELKITDGRPKEFFMAEPNVDIYRRVISSTGGVLDLLYKWTPDATGPIYTR